MTVPTRPVLRYHGGKWKLAEWIISNMPKHRIYVEPFGGAASVLLRKRRSYAEIYNDKWDAVVNVFQVLRDPKKSEQLKQLLELTPFSRSEFNEAFRRRPQLPADVECARLTILRSYAGFGSASTNGEYATGFRCNSNRSGTTPAHDWSNYPSPHRRLREKASRSGYRKPRRIGSDRTTRRTRHSLLSGPALSAQHAKYAARKRSLRRRDDG